MFRCSSWRSAQMCQKLQNKTHLDGKGEQWLWRNQQFRYFREFLKQSDICMCHKNDSDRLQPLAQRHLSWERRNKVTRLPLLEGLVICSSVNIHWKFIFLHRKVLLLYLLVSKNTSSVSVTVTVKNTSSVSENFQPLVNGNIRILSG